ncbi:hypothetical protein POUND7_008523 [Theobroma cacao]
MVHLSRREGRLRLDQVSLPYFFVECLAKPMLRNHETNGREGIEVSKRRKKNHMFGITIVYETYFFQTPGKTFPAGPFQERFQFEVTEACASNWSKQISLERR